MGGRALDLDVAAHEARELTRDGESEAGPAIRARRARVRLREHGEESGSSLLAYPDACVLYACRDGGRATIDASVQPDAHGALVGELDRVADQVGEDLAQATRIGAYGGGHVGAEVDGELDALAEVGAELGGGHRGVLARDRGVVGVEHGRSGPEDRGADQVGDDLCYPNGVAEHRKMCIRSRLDDQGHALGVGARALETDDVLDHLQQVEGACLELQATRLDLREIQDVVDQGEQATC